MTHPDLAESPLERAREAFRRDGWQQAYELFTAADEAQGLSPGDLADLGEAAFASGQYTEAIQALERAYTAFTELNDAPHAAQVALALVIPHGARGATARRRRLVEHGLSTPCGSAGLHGARADGRA